MVDGAVQSSVLYSIRWALMRGSNDAEDLLMYLNQPVPLAYYPFPHLRLPALSRELTARTISRGRS